MLGYFSVPRLYNTTMQNILNVADDAPQTQQSVLMFMKEKFYSMMS